MSNRLTVAKTRVLEQEPGRIIVQTGEKGPAGPAGPLGPKSVTLINPTNAENVTMFYAQREVALSELRAVVSGNSPSVTFSIRFGADRSAPGTEVIVGGVLCTNVASGISVTSFNNAVIPAGSWVWLTTTAMGGLVDALHVSLMVN